jgi:uroporphyrinogen-III synthase
MAAELTGIGVLVTRPAHQADGLCRRIEQAGGRAIRFPVIEIVPPADPAAAVARFSTLDDYDLVIFVSANAVHLAPPADTWSGSPRLAAIGRATARALEQAGRPADICPASGFNSEALLAMDALQDMGGRRVLIVRGEGGRELLADTLRRRGAEVDYAEVYRRQRPEVDPARVLALWSGGAVDVVTATSNETLQNLYDLLDGPGRGKLLATPLVVVSERMVQLAVRLGFSRPPVVAEEAGDEGLMKALLGVWGRAEKTDD